jgi:hypothetical protein
LEAFQQATGIVTINSTAGIDALIAGCNVYCHHRAFYNSCSVGLTPALFTGEPSPNAGVVRDKLLRRVAYAQWTRAEVMSGVPLAWLVAQGLKS